MGKTIEFTKMHGAGNDYIYVNTMKYDIADPARISELWSKYHTGIGSDGLVLIGKSDVADFSMRIFNADGSEAMMCGNASRCIGKYVYDKGLTDKTEVTLDTLSGIKYLSLHTENGLVRSVTVDMGEPALESEKMVATPTGKVDGVELKAGECVFNGTFVSMGNSHLVIFVDSIDDVPVDVVGPQLERHPLFPERINVEFVQKLSDGTLRMRVWERGSGITQACGTGACATAVAASLTGNAGRESVVRMDGGDLKIEWRETDGRVYMTGPATMVFDGKIEIDE